MVGYSVAQNDVVIEYVRPQETKYTLYLVRELEDKETGEFYDDEPKCLHISYASFDNAVIARDTMETLYGEGNIEIVQE